MDVTIRDTFAYPKPVILFFEKVVLELNGDFDYPKVQTGLLNGVFKMRKIILASVVAVAAASAANAGGVAPVVPQAPVTVVPAAPAGSSVGANWIILGVVAALIAASGS